MRILYLYSGTMGFSLEPRRNSLWYLSRHLEGDFVCVWCTHSQQPERLAADTEKALGRFRFHYRIRCGSAGPPSPLGDVPYYVRKGLQLRRSRGPYDAIVSYGPYKTGLAGSILKRITGTPLIVEVPGNPRRAMKFGGGMLRPLKTQVAPRVVRGVLNRADHIRLLYPTQVDGLTDATTPRSVFHNFVPVSLVPHGEPTENYIIFVGFPWDLKGVDVLIRAFNMISPSFPEIGLRVVGYCPDRSPYERLAAGNQQIQFSEPLENDVVLQWIARSRFLVLPSRTEAMGRVLLEAMAAGRPVIGSAVDGIPHYIRDGFNGLLFPLEDERALAQSMTRLLSDRALAERLGKAGRDAVLSKYSEDRYSDLFAKMVENVVDAHARKANAFKKTGSA